MGCPLGKFVAECAGAESLRIYTSGRLFHSQAVQHPFRRRGQRLHPHKLHEAAGQGQLKGDEVDSRLMELLEENSKNNVSNIYTQEIKKDSDSPNRIPPRPQTNEFKIPPRARDGKTFSTDLTQKEMLEKIINQNKIIIEELKKVNK